MWMLPLYLHVNQKSDYIWWPTSSTEQNHFSNFGSVLSQKYLCEIILELAGWLRRRCNLKKLLMTENNISIFRSGRYFVQRSTTSLAIFFESYKRSISVKLF